MSSLRGFFSRKNFLPLDRSPAEATSIFLATPPTYSRRDPRERGARSNRIEPLDILKCNRHRTLAKKEAPAAE